MATDYAQDEAQPAWHPNAEELEVVRISRTAHDYILAILEHRGPGGSFNVHKDIIRRKSPMIATWIDKRPELNHFSMSNTNELAVAMLILWMYQNGNMPTLLEVGRAWPEFAVKAADGRPLPPGPDYDFLEFMTRVQTYSLATRYVVSELKDMLSDAAYHYLHRTLLAHSDKGKDALSVIFAHTDADDRNLRSRVVALCASMKPYLDTSPEGKAAILIIEITVPWTWITCLRLFEKLARDALPANTGTRSKSNTQQKVQHKQLQGLESSQATAL